MSKPAQQPKPYREPARTATAARDADRGDREDDRRSGRYGKPSGELIGYARVSTAEQITDSQVSELRAFGCTKVNVEYVSGIAKVHPVLTDMVNGLKPGQTFVAVRIDRVSRSLLELLKLMEAVQERGANFHLIEEPPDVFSRQILGAVAQKERELISARTKASLRELSARGVKLGNPRLLAGDPEAIAMISEARERAYLLTLTSTMDGWMPLVRQLRPEHPWETVARFLNSRGGRALAGGKPWTTERLRRAVRRLARDGLAKGELLEKSPARSGDDRLMTLVAGISLADKDLSLREIGALLESMRERTPRGNARWAASSVKQLLDRARAKGLVD